MEETLSLAQFCNCKITNDNQWMTNRRRRDDSSVNSIRPERGLYGNHTCLKVMNNRIWTSRECTVLCTYIVQSSYEELRILYNTTSFETVATSDAKGVILEHIHVWMLRRYSPVLVRRLYWRTHTCFNIHCIYDSNEVGKEYEKENSMVQRCTNESKSRSNLEGI